MYIAMAAAGIIGAAIGSYASSEGERVEDCNQLSAFLTQGFAAPPSPAKDTAAADAFATQLEQRIEQLEFAHSGLHTVIARVSAVRHDEVRTQGASAIADAMELRDPVEELRKDLERALSQGKEGHWEKLRTTAAEIEEEHATVLQYTERAASHCGGGE